MPIRKDDIQGQPESVAAADVPKEVKPEQCVQRVWTPELGWRTCELKYEHKGEHKISDKDDEVEVTPRGRRVP